MPTITDLPDPPLRSEDPATFVLKAEAWVAALSDFVTEANALAAYLETLTAASATSWKQAVRAGTTANGTLSTAYANGQTIDGVTLATGDRILLKNQTTGSENGIYTVNASGAPTRATDADSGAELVNATVYISEGTTLADTQWTCTTNATITVGSTSLAFAQLSGGGASAGPITASGLTQATGKILGRTTASTGSIEEISVGTGLSLSGGSLTATGGGTGTVDAVTEYTSTTPAAPATGLTIFDRKRAGAHALAAISPVSNFELARALYLKPMLLWEPNNSSGGSGFGYNMNNSGGGATNPSTSTWLTSQARNTWPTSTGAGSSASFRNGQATFWRGNATGLGGFFFLWRFAVTVMASANRWFVGMTSTTASLANADPSATLNMVGIGCDAGDSNVQVMTNDGSGTATKTDLGSNFPGKTATAVYELRLFCKPDDSTVYYSVTRISATDGTLLYLSEGSLSSDLPDSGTFLSPQLWVNNGAVTGNPQLDLLKMYGEIG